MTIAETVAQSDLIAPLYTYGPLGVITGFFMLVSYKLVGLGGDLVKAIKGDNEQLRATIATLAHRIDGLQRALLADMIERDTIGPQTRAYAEKALAKIDVRNTHQ